jgi:hypothetical protein
MASGIDSIDQLIAELENQGAGPRNDPAMDAVAAIKRVWALAYLKGLRHGVVHGLGGIAEAERIAMGRSDHMGTDQGSSAISATSSPSLKIDMQPRTQRGRHDATVLDIVRDYADSGITYHYICKAAQGIGVTLSDSSVRKILPRLERQGMVLQREGKWFPSTNAAMNSQQHDASAALQVDAESESTDVDDTTSS